MRVSIEDLRAFVRVAELGSFNRAASDLALTQSALSRRLQKLEEILGARILDRTSRRVELTTVGEAFLPAARSVIGHMERALGDVRDFIEMRSGTVTVAAVPTVAYSVMPGVIGQFNEAHPGVKVRVLDEGGATVVSSVVQGEAEFGVVIEDDSHSELHAEPVLQDPFVLACPAAHPLAGVEQMRWADLEGHRYIRLGEDSLNQRVLARALLPLGALPEGSVEVQHLFTAVGFLRDGVGVAALPALSARSLVRTMDLDIVIRELVDPVVERRIAIVEQPERSLSPAAAVLRELTAKALKGAAGTRTGAATTGKARRGKITES